jgi:hypothetical protein
MNRLIQILPIRHPGYLPQVAVVAGVVVEVVREEETVAQYLRVLVV